MFKRLLLLFTIMYLCPNLYAQVVGIDSIAEKRYLYRVKTIEEFIERFNNDQQSFLRQQYKQQNKPFKFTDKQLLVHLFDPAINWDAKQTKSFFNTIFQSGEDYKLKFVDSNWYASVVCKFRRGGRDLYIPMKLKVKNRHPSGARWVICDIDSIAEERPSPIFNLYKPEKFAFIPSSSHATNFVVFNDVFNDVANLPVYFDEALLAEGKANHFIKLLKEKEIQFGHVSSISFYFFQIKNWAFKVSEVQRDGLNQGWLITQLFEVND